MTRYTVMALLALGIATPAQAADLLGDASLRGASQPFSSSATLTTVNWSGPYFGVFGGLPLHSKMKTESGPLTAPYVGGATRTTISGAGGGALAGFNAQEGNFVFGGEADLGAYTLRARQSASTATTSLNERINANYIATFRGRVGFGIGPMLFYATGGAAVTTLKATIDASATPGGPFHYANDQTVFGYAAGGGIEYAVSNGFNLRAEYLYTAFNRAKYADAGRVKLHAGFARVAVVSQF